jgi:hypothetical protein
MAANNVRQNIRLSAPIVLGAFASATDVATITHNAGAAAEEIEILESVSRQSIGPAQTAPPVVGLPAAVVTSNGVNSLAVQNQGSVAMTVVLRVTFKTPSAALGSQLPTAVLS